MKLRDSREEGRGKWLDGFTLEGLNGRDSGARFYGWTLNEALMGNGHGFLECNAGIN